MRASENVADFLLNTVPGGRQIRARLGVTAPSLDSTVRRVGDVIELRVESTGRNSWVDKDGLATSEFQTLGEGSTLQIRMQDGTPRLTELGWLRSAFLIAFASLGYSYIYQSNVERIRNQVRTPQEVSVRNFHMVQPDSQTDLRELALIKEPPQLINCVLVKMGRHSILLPAVGADDDPYEQWDGEQVGKTAVSLAYGRMPWPKRPELRMDFREPGGD